jgi:hypothetical protein
LDGELLCPLANIDTGSTITESSLQATMAILATSPENAHRIQDRQDGKIRFHVFDILRFRGDDLTSLPLADRQDFLIKAVQEADNPFLEMIPSFVVGKANIHRHIIEGDGEGTVWKKVDQSYEPGRRVGHWLKRKRGIEVEAFVTGFKPGTNGHSALVGAVEFGIRNPDGSTLPIAWVSSLSDDERSILTAAGLAGPVQMAQGHVGRRAIIAGQELSAKAGRLRHARLVRWVDPIDVSTR